MEALRTAARPTQQWAESTTGVTGRRRLSRNRLGHLAVAITPAIASVVAAAPAFAWPEIGG